MMSKDEAQQVMEHHIAQIINKVHPESPEDWYKVIGLLQSCIAVMSCGIIGQEAAVKTVLHTAQHISHPMFAAENFTFTETGDGKMAVTFRNPEDGPVQ